MGFIVSLRSSGSARGAAAVAVVIGAALASSWAARPASRWITRVPPPAIVRIPIATPVVAPVVVESRYAVTTRPSCPPARTDAPWLEPALDEQVTSVRPSSTNAGWIAAWNGEHVFVSTDAGRSFHRVLDGPGAVRDVAFDCDGHALVLREDRVGVADGAREAWHRVPGIGVHADPAAPSDDDDDLLPAALAGGGPDVVVLGSVSTEAWSVRLAVSADLGASWHGRELADSFEGDTPASAAQDADGTIRVAFPRADCAGDGLYWATIRGDVVDADQEDDSPAHVEVFGDLAVTAGDHGEWRRRHGRWRPIAGLPSQIEDVLPGAFPTIVSGGVAYRIVGGRARELPLFVQGEPKAIDRAGRIWSIACGHLLIARRAPVDLGVLCGRDI